MKRISIFNILFLLPTTFGFLDSLIPKAPQLNIGFVTKPAVPICPESQNKLQTVLNQAFNTTLFEPKPPSKQELDVCKYIFDEKFKKMNPNDERRTCDYSYVVAIKTRRNGEPHLTIVCEGLLLCDGTVAAPYDCIQLGEGLWVTFHNDINHDTFEVVCVKEAELLFNNVLGTIFIVQLVIDVPHCRKLTNIFPKFATSAEITDGYLISRDCSSSDISWNSIHSVLVSATFRLEFTSVEIKIVIPSDPDAVCQPFYGGTPFIDKDCNVQGMAFRRPALLLGTLFEVPLANQISTACVITILTPFFDICNERVPCVSGC